MKPFCPPRYLRGTHTQTALASSRLRGRLIRRRGQASLVAAEAILIDAGAGVRLSGSVLARGSEGERWVVLLHGWEGSIHSTYLMDATTALWQAGYSVIRINLRDHGDSHHLNPELFHSCRIDEVVGAIARVARDFACSEAIFLAGYSLGGNFALRVGLRAPAAGIDIDRIVAVCPVIDPAHSLTAIERAPWPYQAYFMRKWRRSLRIKQACFKDRYRFGSWLDRGGVRALTGELIERYTDFPSIDAYLDGYSVAHTRLRSLTVASTIIATADDPINPLGDFLDLQIPACLTLDVQTLGGHCGFIEDFRLSSWISRRLVQEFQAANARPSRPCGDRAGGSVAQSIQ